VTLSPGVYIMAGGGFHVCGASNLHAAGVMIYNTSDPDASAATYGILTQFELNTTGTVTLSPQTSGTYAGLTIFQDPTQDLEANQNDTCDKKSHGGTIGQDQFDDWDISLRSMASSGSNGPLGSLSGTIYAPANQALFADQVSGKANLAVLTGCIYVGNGADTTFNFLPSNGGLFGISPALTG